MTNGASISSNTDGVGNARNITINARDNVTFSGFLGGLGSSVFTGGVGKAGNIQPTFRTSICSTYTSIISSIEG
ncbi:MAG: hypothetical protein HEP80_08780 [Dolichospermum sp. UKL201]|nr:MAG: hypothetical protein HEP80_08780 [Dolichospermum sp. UKL201]